MRTHQLHVGNEDGFSILDLLASMSIIAILAMIVVPQLIMAWDRGRQRRTMAEMRNLSTALATYQIDHKGFPMGFDGLDSLLPDYYGKVPTTGWQTPFFYVGVAPGGCGYILIGTGADGLFGPAPPDPWFGDFPDPDIILVNGTFLQAPGLDVRASELNQVLLNACT